MEARAETDEIAKDFVGGSGTAVGAGIGICYAADGGCWCRIRKSISGGGAFEE